MRASMARSMIGALASASLLACSGLLPSGSQTPSVQPPSDPTPLAKCQVAASSTSPLVTEWPASEKAHLQSLAATRIVAVEYSGCELRIVDSCALSGAYDWRRTTLATDVVEIESADDLYAKLPIGAVALEGELARSGRLAVRSTVAGQLHSQPIDGRELTNPGCQGATHYVSAISVGAFQLLSGADVSGRGGVEVMGAGAGTRASRREVVLREAGSRESCAETTDQAAHSQCASPIQVFLTSLPKRSGDAPASGSEDPNLAAAVKIGFPSPDDEDEVWTLRAPGGRVICTLPCDDAVGPVSGKYLQREPRNGYSSFVLPLPQSFAHPVGSRVTAEYQAERGNPTLARWAFIGSIPIGLMGVGLTTWGIVQSTRTCYDTRDQEEDCFPPGGFLIGSGVFMMVMAGGAAWWHFYSHDQEFNTYEQLATVKQPKQSGPRVVFSLDGVRGSF